MVLVSLFTSHSLTLNLQKREEGMTNIWPNRIETGSQRLTAKERCGFKCNAPHVLGRSMCLVTIPLSLSLHSTFSSPDLSPLKILLNYLKNSQFNTLNRWPSNIFSLHLCPADQQLNGNIWHPPHWIPSWVLWVLWGKIPHCDIVLPGAVTATSLSLRHPIECSS